MLCITAHYFESVRHSDCCSNYVHFLYTVKLNGPSPSKLYVNWTDKKGLIAFSSAQLCIPIPLHNNIKGSDYPEIWTDFLPWR